MTVIVSVLLLLLLLFALALLLSLSNDLRQISTWRAFAMLSFMPPSLLLMVSGPFPECHDAEWLKTGRLLDRTKESLLLIVVIGKQTVHV